MSRSPRSATARLAREQLRRPARATAYLHDPLEEGGAPRLRHLHGDKGFRLGGEHEVDEAQVARIARERRARGRLGGGGGVRTLGARVARRRSPANHQRLLCTHAHTKK